MFEMNKMFSKKNLPSEEDFMVTICLFVGIHKWRKNIPKLLE